MPYVIGIACIVMSPALLVLCALEFILGRSSHSFASE